MFFKNIFQFSKRKYIVGDNRPKVDCILCSSLNKNEPAVPDLSVVQSDTIVININLYPYNTGHLMVFPKRHVTDIRDLTEQEETELRVLTNFSLDLLDELYAPVGYNVGYNLGKSSGASIDHIHQHVIPRFPNELGIVDIIGGSKVIIEEPNITRDKLRKLALERADKLQIKVS